MFWSWLPRLVPITLLNDRTLSKKWPSGIIRSSSHFTDKLIVTQIYWCSVKITWVNDEAGRNSWFPDQRWWLFTTSSPWSCAHKSWLREKQVRMNNDIVTSNEFIQLIFTKGFNSVSHTARIRVLGLWHLVEIAQDQKLENTGFIWSLPFSRAKTLAELCHFFEPWLLIWKMSVISPTKCVLRI